MTEVPRSEFDVHAFITENDELEVFKLSTVYRGVAAGLVEKAYLAGRAATGKDAERYRWTRDKGCNFVWCEIGAGNFRQGLDEAIDAAMAKERQA